MLATGLLSDFMDIASDSHFIGHLSSYGILSINKDRKPEIQFPTLRRYLKSQASREKGRVAGRYLVDNDKRAFWIDSVRKRIIEDFRVLSDNLQKSQKNMIYITNGIPDSDMLLSTDVVNSENSFRSFISTCNQVFIENIVNHSGPSHYKTQFAAAHPYLKDSYDRVRCYRHWQNHKKIDDSEVNDNFKKFLEKDIGGKTNLLDGEDWFVLQQITLDEIHSALQWEIASLAS
ncbi:hypothetical protein VF13_38735 [Nostoc linckia z16]|nr:hypothetical protein VF12_38500 [Nostoc linckia z15]PHK32554.1 hypothetical protein VF13_38735 [Nostoc linckia z16]